MDFAERNRRQRTLKKKSICVKSLGSGELSCRNTVIRTSVKSLASGTLTASTAKDNSFSVGSTVSADSFVLVLDSYADDDDASEDFHDPYLGRRRRRTVKPEPQIPRFHDAVEGHFDDDFLTAYTSPETASPSSSPPGGTTTTLMTTKTLHLPATPSFARGDTASVSTSVTMSSKEAELAAKAEKEQTYWKTMVSTRTRTYGKVSRQTAEATFALGQAHMRSNDFDEAMAAFRSASRIWTTLEGPTHLSVGRALDAFGLAALRSKNSASTLRQAKKALDEAFAIRFYHLGVWHVDTVETYNKLASVHLHVGQYREAAKAYEEVYLVRKAIFGLNHPSVAISAHSLANVHFRLSQQEESCRFFNVALDIYTNMNLSPDHPTVARLLRDQKRLERISLSAMNC
jgi:hypothetical protein